LILKIKTEKQLLNKFKMITHMRTYSKNTRVLIFALGMLLSASSLQVKGQAPQFSQFYAAPLYLAPSFAGATDGSRLVMNYRNQWPSIPGAFVTYAFSFDHYFHKYNSGVGVLLFRDQAGSGRLANTQGGLVYSYNFKLNHDWTMRPGLQFLYAERTVDFHRHIFGDQLTLDEILPNSNVPNPIERVGYFDASSSLLAYNPNSWFGFAIDNLMMPNQSMTGEESRIPMKFSFFGGYRFHYGGRYSQQVPESISLAMLYKNQGKFNQIDFGVYWSKDPISLGILYRGIPLFNNQIHGLSNNDALVVTGGLRTQNLRIAYSYDFTVSRLVNSTGGAHEISLIFQFNQGAPSKKQGQIPCPDGQF
jgi:type IX secretion system PorP/SprF family membrane protein